MFEKHLCDRHSILVVHCIREHEQAKSDLDLLATLVQTQPDLVAQVKTAISKPSVKSPIANFRTEPFHFKLDGKKGESIVHKIVPPWLCRIEKITLEDTAGNKGARMVGFVIGDRTAGHPSRWAESDGYLTEAFAANSLGCGVSWGNVTANTPFAFTFKFVEDCTLSGLVYVRVAAR